MESFGLFHFLQTLLSQNGAPTPTEPKTEPQNEPVSPSERKEDGTVAEPTISSSQEAALEFLYRHEADAKRRRKK